MVMMIHKKLQKNPISYVTEWDFEGNTMRLPNRASNKTQEEEGLCMLASKKQ